MKFTIKQFLYFVVLFVVLYSCKREIDYKYKPEKISIVIDGKLIAHEPIDIKITKSLPLLGYGWRNYIDNAELNVYENEVFIGKAQYTKNGRYELNHLIKPNSTYKIKVNCPEYETVEASTSIPNDIFEIKVDTVQVTYSNGVGLNIDIAITDNANETNFYAIYALTNKSEKTYNYELNDSVIMQHAVFMYTYDKSVKRSDESEFYLDDKTFNGGTKTIRFEFFQPENEYLYFYVASVSEPMYKFLTGLVDYDKAKENPLAEPVNVYSNIKGGFGILGGIYHKKDSILFPRRYFNK